MQATGYFVGYKLYYHSFTEIATCLMIVDSNEEDQEEVILSTKQCYKTKMTRLKFYLILHLESPSFVND